MGKVLGIIALVFLIMVGSCVGCLYLAYKEGANIQADFYNVVSAGDLAKLKAQFRPDVAKAMGDATLEARMSAVNEHLGAFTGMSASGFSLSIEHGSDGKLVRSGGTAEFEKGSAKSMLVLIDDKVIDWIIESDRLPDGAIATLGDISLYDARALVFLRAAIAGEVDTAWDLMHENLQKNVGKEKWATMLEAIKGRYASATLKLDHHKVTLGSPVKLLLHYGVEGAEGSPIMVTFHFHGGKAHLLGFNFALR